MLEFKIKQLNETPKVTRIREEIRDLESRIPQNIRLQVQSEARAMRTGILLSFPIILGSLSAAIYSPDRLWAGVLGGCAGFLYGLFVSNHTQIAYLATNNEKYDKMIYTDENGKKLSYSPKLDIQNWLELKGFSH